MISDESVVAAMKALLDMDDEAWPAADPSYLGYLTPKVRAALAAAAPFIAAQAWDEGEHAGYMNRSAEERHGIEPHTNPYRSEQ